MTSAELLGQLRGLSIPENVEVVTTSAGIFWPVVVGIAVLIGAVFFSKWRSLAWRRQAERELSQIEALARSNADGYAWQRLGVLLRRLTLHADANGRATDVGEPWLAKLDEVFHTQFFVQGAGRSILDLPYRKPQVDERETLFRTVAVVRDGLASIRATVR